MVIFHSYGTVYQRVNISQPDKWDSFHGAYVDWWINISQYTISQDKHIPISEFHDRIDYITTSRLHWNDENWARETLW